MRGAGKPRVSPATRRVIEALADTIIPSGDPGRPGALDVNLCDPLLAWLAKLPGATTAFLLACWCWEFSPIWAGKFARFSRLSFEDRTWVLEGWEVSRLGARRWALFGLKLVFMSAFYNNPEIWPYIGYKEGCLTPPPKLAEG
jgi:hypothetical protein